MDILKYCVYIKSAYEMICLKNVLIFKVSREKLTKNSSSGNLRNYTNNNFLLPCEQETI